MRNRVFLTAIFAAAVAIFAGCQKNSDITPGPIYINGREAVDLGLSVKWATCNVGADSPYMTGYSYQWAGTQTSGPTMWANCPYHIGDDENSNWTKYCGPGMSASGDPDYKLVLDPEDDVAHVEWGGTWRMPTDIEIKELRENCSWKWIGENDGYRVTGPNGNSIFLRGDGTTTFTYWSSSLDVSDGISAWCIYYNDTCVGIKDYYRCLAFFVRPVSN